MRPVFFAFIFLCSILLVQLAYAVGLKDGTYTGRHPFITVSVDVKNGLIKDIKIIDHAGGEEYTEKVSPIIPEIINKQSLEVEAITGATISSDAIKGAVKDALEKASK